MKNTEMQAFLKISDPFAPPSPKSKNEFFQCFIWLCEISQYQSDMTQYTSLAWFPRSVKNLIKKHTLFNMRFLVICSAYYALNAKINTDYDWRWFKKIQIKM